MEVDPYELLVRWYLRFNGYLGVENFVVQKAVKGGNVQAGESDILAVRFPNSRRIRVLHSRLTLTISGHSGVWLFILARQRIIL